MLIRNRQTGKTDYLIIDPLPAVILLIVAILAALLFQVFARARDAARASTCQGNMKELGVCLQMYTSDYDNILPSSALLGSKTWNRADYIHFATKRGTLPPKGTRQDTWAELLWTHMKNKDTIWCPSTYIKRRQALFWTKKIYLPTPQNPDATVSYWYKAAVDRAWYGDKDSRGKWACRKTTDFKLPAEQIVFYENARSHWGNPSDGLANGVTINATYLDGHVQPVTLKDAGNSKGKSNPTAPGEPGWFNYNYKSSKSLGKGKFFDARTCGDDLP